MKGLKMPIDPSIVDPSTLASIKQTFDTFRTAIGLVKDLKSISGGMVYFPAYCSMVSGSWELGHGPPRDLFSAINLRHLAPPHCVVLRNVTPPLGGSERSARSANTRRCRIVVDEGGISNTLVSLSFVREQTIAVPAENPDAVPRVCPK